jgi:sugar transferase (PEP-CTERM/EpsH1 system associated)
LKILWVKSGGLVPLDTGGKIRSFHLLRELAKLHTVDLFTFYPKYEGDTHGDLAQFVHQVTCQPLSISQTHSVGDYAHYVLNLLSSTPYSVAKDCRPEVWRKLRDLLGRQNYDLLLCDFVHTAAVLPWDWPGPKVIFTHNVEARIWERHCRVSKNLIWKVVSWREYRMMSRMERRYTELADFVLTVSEDDTAFFSQFLPAEKLATVPTGVDVEYFRTHPGTEQPNSLVFTGSMDWMPNQDAIWYFVKAILPFIQAEIPAVTLWVVGRNPSAELQLLAQDNPAVRVTGTVDDIRPFVQRASVYVVPLRIGGGTRIKIYEAMAMGKAVVSTVIGAEGLPVTHSENILLCDEPQEFAQIVVRLLRNPEERQRIAQSGRKLVEANYSWASAAQVLAKTLARVADQYQGRPPRSGRPGSSGWFRQKSSVA